MDLIARVSSKGQITNPKPVREALGLNAGDEVVFRLIEGRRASLAGTPDLLELAGSVRVPPEVRGLSWDEIRGRAWAAQNALIKRIQTRPNGTKRDRSSARRAPTGAPTGAQKQRLAGVFESKRAQPQKPCKASSFRRGLCFGRAARLRRPDSAGDRARRGVRLRRLDGKDAVEPSRDQRVIHLGIDRKDSQQRTVSNA